MTVNLRKVFEIVIISGMFVIFICLFIIYIGKYIPGTTIFLFFIFIVYIGKYIPRTTIFLFFIFIVYIGKYIPRTTIFLFFIFIVYIGKYIPSLYFITVKFSHIMKKKFELKKCLLLDQYVF
jgi:hypothetical protein